MSAETPSRIEPARLDEPTGPIADAIAELSASAAPLGKALHPVCFRACIRRLDEQEIRTAGDPGVCV